MIIFRTTGLAQSDFLITSMITDGIGHYKINEPPTSALIGQKVCLDESM